MRWHVLHCFVPCVILKTTQMNMLPSLIWELIFYDFERDRHTGETTNSIRCAKDESVVDYNTVTRLFKKFCSDYKNLDNQARSSRFKSVDFEIVLLVIEPNPASSAQRVSGELGISQFSVVRHFDDLCKKKIKSIRRCRIMRHVTKILQNFWFTLVHK